MEYIHNLIWLCPLLFIAGFIDSIAGGGGLIALPAYMMCGMPIYYVYGCNKFQCAFGSTVAAWKYFKNGCLDLKIILISAVTSFLCSMLGTRIIFYLKEEQIRSMLMVLLPLTAILVVFMKNAWNYTDTRKSLTVPVALKALLIGMTLADPAECAPRPFHRNDHRSLRQSLRAGRRYDRHAALHVSFKIRCPHCLRKREAHVDRFQLHSASLLYPFRKCVLHDRDPVCRKQRSRKLYRCRLRHQKRRENHPAGDDLRSDGADRENCSWKVKQVKTRFASFPLSSQ